MPDGNIGPTVEKLLADLKTKLQRQTASVKQTQDHMAILERNQHDLFKGSPK